MESMVAILGFAAAINGINHPAAIFKFSGKDAYWWSWLQPSNGHLLSIDLLSRKAEPFVEVTEFHGSYHNDGRQHRAIGVNTIGVKHTGVSSGTPVPDIKGWEELISITVPLLQPFAWEMQAKPWSAVRSPHLLRPEDFCGAEGIDLRGFICRSDRVDDLIRRPRVKTHWIAGDQDLRLLVLAEPILSTRG
jgi:hypothetical protein